MIFEFDGEGRITSIYPSVEFINEMYGYPIERIQKAVDTGQLYQGVFFSTQPQGSTFYYCGGKQKMRARAFRNILLFPDKRPDNSINDYRVGKEPIKISYIDIINEFSY